MPPTDQSEHVRTVDSATPRLTIKRERFAQAVVRLAGNKSAAYRECYECSTWDEHSINAEASWLASIPDVSTRIQQLEAEATASASVSPAFVLSRLARNADDALTKPRTPQFGASNQALEMLARWLRMPGYDRASATGDTTNIQVNVQVEQLRQQFTTAELLTMHAQIKANQQQAQAQLEAPGAQQQEPGTGGKDVS